MDAKIDRIVKTTGATKKVAAAALKKMGSVAAAITSLKTRNKTLKAKPVAIVEKKKAPSKKNIAKAVAAPVLKKKTVKPPAVKRTVTRKSPGVYYESQKALLCGKHALNHILQEEKYVWVHGDNTVLLGGKDPMKKNTKINLWSYCGEFEKAKKLEEVGFMADEEANTAIAYMRGTKKAPTRKSKSATGKYDYSTKEDFDAAKAGFTRQLKEYKARFKGFTDEQIRTHVRDDLIASWNIPEEDLCNRDDDSSAGMLPIQAFPSMVAMLGLESKILDRITASDLYRKRTGSEPTESSFEEEFHVMLRTELLKPSCLGIVVNKQGPAHWTAVVKFSPACKKNTYAYIDSLVCSTKNNCFDINTLITNHLSDGTMSGAVFLYQKAGSYKSVASTLGGM